MKRSTIPEGTTTVEGLARFLYLRHDQQYDHRVVTWARLTSGTDEWLADRWTADRYRRDATAILKHLGRAPPPSRIQS